MLPYFFFHHPDTTEIYTLSLHDALPISARSLRSGPEGLAVLVRASRADPGPCVRESARIRFICPATGSSGPIAPDRSEEHTSELQSRFDLVCRLLLEKKK